MIRKVENQIIKEKCYTNRPKTIYLLKNAEISPCEIGFLVDYDRVNMPTPVTSFQILMFHAIEARLIFHDGGIGTAKCLLKERRVSVHI